MNATEGNGAKVHPGQRFTASNPCPICKGHEGRPRGRGERCTGYLSGSGKFAFCERVESPEILETAAGTLYKHRIDQVDRLDRPATKNGKRKGKGHRTPQEAAQSYAAWHRRERYDIGKLTAHWTYHDTGGRAVLTVFRFDRIDPETGEPDKDYRPFHRGPDNLWRSGDPDGPLPLYQLPTLAGSDLVVICEGEKAADAVRSLGLVGTSPAHGAESPQRSDWSPLAGKNLVILPDNDDKGRKFADHVLELLSALDPPPTVKTLELPDLPPKGDAVEWIEAGGTTEYFIDLIEAAEPVELPLVAVDGHGRIPSETGRLADGNEGPVNEAPDDPHRLARAVMAEFQHPDGPTLAWHGEAFHVWRDAAYRVDPGFGGQLVAMVKAEVDRQNRLALAEFREQATSDAMGPPRRGRPAGPPVATKVTRRLIADVSQALSSIAMIDQEADTPFWIRPKRGDPDPTLIMPAANGLVDLSGDQPILMPHSPRFFSTFALPYPYRTDAPRPDLWLRFLDDLWSGDPASVRELQKWFGYLLTPDISQEKILLLIGSTRSGRSTIKDVMAAMIGHRNVASTSAIALADRFGLEPLVGKTLAILGDARTGDTHDAAVMLDRLLRISGRDPVEVNRKGKPILKDVSMKTRLVIVSNEMPNIRDSSGAIVTRYLPLCTPRSFAGREDTSLKGKLLSELPGILNWAIEGRAMLCEDGRFLIPASAEGLIDEARTMASPVSEFVAERCDLRDDLAENCQAIYGAWKSWCEERGYKAGNSALLGRNLRSASGFKVDTRQVRENGIQVRKYTGIALKITF